MIEVQIAAFAAAVFASIEAIAGKYGSTILLLSIGIAIYAAIVGTFYTFLSRRVLYELKPENVKLFSSLSTRLRNIAALILTYTVLFPAISFLWFVMISVFVFILSRTSSLETVFVLSISVVTAVRILAYYKESLAADLAKLLPLVFLGVTIIDPTLFTRQLVEERVLLLAGALPDFVAAMAFVIGLEWALRLLYTIAKALHLAHAEIQGKGKAG